MEAAKFRHPNIVRVYRMGRIPPARKRWYLATEYMAAAACATDYARTAQPDGRRALGRDLLAALTAVEMQGVLHRNITPSCILFDRNARPS